MGRFSMTLSHNEVEDIKQHFKHSDDIPLQTACNDLVKQGLASFQSGHDDQERLREMVRDVVQATMKPQVEILASFASKCSHMAGRFLFLTVQLVLDQLGVNKESRAEIGKQYQGAVKLAEDNMIYKDKE